MKKLLVMLMCVGTILACGASTDDKPITIEQLPAQARNFIDQHFPNNEVAYVTKDNDLFDKNYEVGFINGNKVDFDKDGLWTEIDCERTQVPVSAVPAAIANYINDKYNGLNILSIDRDSRDYEVKLSNGLELKFDLNYNFMSFD